MNIDELDMECQAIQSFLEEEIYEDIHSISERGNKLNVYLARTGELMKVATYIYNASKASQVGKIVQEVIIAHHLSSKVQNALIDSISAREQSLVVWTERLNHQPIVVLQLSKTVSHRHNWHHPIAHEFPRRLVKIQNHEWIS